MEFIKNFFKNNKWLWVFLCAIPFYNDSYEKYQLISDWYMDYFKIFVFVILIIYLFVKRKKPSPLLISLFFIEIWWLIATLFNYSIDQGTVYHKLLIDMINALSVGLIIECFKDDGASLVKGLILNFEISIYFNLFSVFFRLIDHDYHYFLGFYAVLILWILPAIVVSILYMIIFKKYIRASLLILASLITAYKVWCATIVVALLGMGGIILLGYLMSKTKIFHKYKIPLSLLMVFVFLANLFVIFVYSGNGSYPFIDVFIEKFLRRNTTFTGRTEIWAVAMNMFLSSPIYGNGFRPSVTIPTGYVFIHSHNQFLQRLNATGAVGLVLFMIFHIILCIKVDKQPNVFARTVLVGACFAIFLTYITEAYKKFFRLYIVFFIAYHVIDIIKNNIAKEKQ